MLHRINQLLTTSKTGSAAGLLGGVLHHSVRMWQRAQMQCALAALLIDTRRPVEWYLLV